MLTHELTGPIEYISFIVTIISYILGVLNVIALYAAFVATIRAAPVEIRDYLGNLRQQMCEERWALRQQSRELRAKITIATASVRHSQHRHFRRRHRRRISTTDDAADSPYERDEYHGSLELLRLTFSEHTLTLHQQLLRDFWRQFKELERPFLVSAGLRANAVREGETWREEEMAVEKVRADIEAHGEAGSFAGWTAMYRCDFSHRFLWYRTKDDVRKLADKLQRLMMQRTEREVSHIRMMVKGLVYDDPEEWKRKAAHHKREESCSSSEDEAVVERVEVPRRKSVVSVWRYRGDEEEARPKVRRRESGGAAATSGGRSGRPQRRTEYVVRRSLSEGGTGYPRTVEV